jgi:hypothetical protein
MMIGDRVKLTPVLARQRTIGCKGAPKRVDWTKRIGSLVHTGKADNAVSGGNVGIRWDGCKALDYWPVTALVVIKPKA